MIHHCQQLFTNTRFTEPRSVYTVQKIGPNVSEVNIPKLYF